MAIINISPADILRSKNLETGWRSFLIKVEGPKPSKDGKSLNYIVTHTLIDSGPDLDGKEISEYFNSGFISKFIPLWAAVKSIPLATVKPESFSFDTDELQEMKVDGLVGTKIFEGVPRNEITSYLPYKQGSNTPAF